MGALKGSIAVRRYGVLDPLPGDFRKRFVKGLRAHPFMPLDPRVEGDKSCGWVSILDGDDADLQNEKLYFTGARGEQLRVSMRIDVLKAPAGELKRQVAARAQEIETREGRPLSRSEKRALKDEVGRALRLRAFPRVRIVDLVWDLDEKRIYFWSQTKAANEAFLELYTKTFALRLEIEGAARWANEAANPKKVAKLEPTPELWTGFPGVRPLVAAAVESEDA